MNGWEDAIIAVAVLLFAYLMERERRRP